MARAPLSPEEKRERRRLLEEARRDKRVESGNMKAALKRNKEFREQEKSRVHIANDDPGFKVWREVAINL